MLAVSFGSRCCIEMYASECGMNDIKLNCHVYSNKKTTTLTTIRRIRRRKAATQMFLSMDGYESMDE